MSPKSKSADKAGSTGERRKQINKTQQNNNKKAKERQQRYKKQMQRLNCK